MKVRRNLHDEQFDTHDVQLGANQDHELQQLVAAIQENGQAQLEEVFREANVSGEGVGDELRQLWERDVILRKDFFEDQLKNSEFMCLLVCVHMAFSLWYKIHT